MGIAIQPNASRVYVSFSAQIDATTTESLIATMAQLANNRVEEVYLLLSSEGGTVMHGLNLYNVLRGMPFRLITHNAGNVDSIGNAVFLAGETRYACEHSSFMFHGVGIATQQGQRFDEKGLREGLGSIQADQRRIGSVIAERTSLEASDVSNLFLEAQTKDVAYAVSHGIVHEIRDIQIAPGDPVVALSFQR